MDFFENGEQPASWFASWFWDLRERSRIRRSLFACPLGSSGCSAMGAEHSVNLTVPPGGCASPTSASPVFVVVVLLVVVVVAVPVASIGSCCATRVFVAESDNVWCLSQNSCGWIPSRHWTHGLKLITWDLLDVGFQQGDDQILIISNMVLSINGSYLLTIQ